MKSSIVAIILTYRRCGRAQSRVFDTYEREYGRALEGDALISAYDYVLKCSHLFNVLDTRGAIGVTERASYFRRMRDMTRTALRRSMLKIGKKWDTL